MKIAICSSSIPFLYGGARNIVDWLYDMLRSKGHTVEKIYLPFVDTPDLLFRQFFAYQHIDLSHADRIICIRPPAHLIPHPHKILWFIHHLRVFYDLWESDFKNFPEDEKHKGLQKAIHALDNQAFKTAKKIFTNSQVVSNRLWHYNRVSSEVLYPPIFQPERFFCQDFNDEIIYLSRIEAHKRQSLLIEALSYTRSPVKLRLLGATSDPNYERTLRDLIDSLGVTQRVIFNNQWIDELTKINDLSACLAVAYLPLDEDSYGYPSLEACHSGKPILTTQDSGGVTELVIDGINGYVTLPTAEALAVAMDALFYDRERTKQMGQNALHHLSTLKISWQHVLNRLLDENINC